MSKLSFIQSQPVPGEDKPDMAVYGAGWSIIIVCFVGWWLLKKLYSYAIDFSADNNIVTLQIFIFVVSVSLAVVAFIIRQKRRKTFGFIELSFGLIGCYEISRVLLSLHLSQVNENSDLYLLLQVAGPVFIIGRALDNIVKGSSKPWKIFQEKLPDQGA